MYKGEWQRVISDRTFFNVNVGNFTLDWPMVVQVDPATRPPQVFRTTNAVAGAGWNAFSTYRKKPQLKAQLTHYLPNKGGSHDFKFGFEVFEDSYRYGHNGQSGPDPLLVCRRGRERAAGSRSGSSTPVPPPATAPTGRWGRPWIVHYAGYAQDRWSPNDQLTFTLGVRLDYQRVGYGDAIRKPLITDVLAGRHPHLPDRRPRSPAQTLVKQHQHRAPSRRHLRPDRQGADRAEGVLRPVLQQHRRQLHRRQPRRPVAIAEYNFLDQNRNGRYDGPSELGTRAPAFRRRFGDECRSRITRRRTTEEISGVVRDPAARRVVGAFHLRAQEHQAMRAVLRHQSGPRMGRTEHGASDAGRIGGETFNLLDVPDSLAGETDSGLRTTSPTGRSTTTPSSSPTTSG